MLLVYLCDFVFSYLIAFEVDWRDDVFCFVLFCFGGGERHGVTYGLNMYFCTSVAASTTSMLPRGQTSCISLNAAVALQNIVPLAVRSKPWFLF